MPQEIQIVKCYKCERFQTQITKKAKKWSCVVCGEKQTLKKVFGTGTGKDCRLQVQKLNEMRQVAEETYEENLDEEHFGRLDEETCLESVEVSEERQFGSPCFQENGEIGPSYEKKVSKWSKYLDDDDPSNEPESN